VIHLLPPRAGISGKPKTADRFAGFRNAPYRKQRTIIYSSIRFAKYRLVEDTTHDGP
jgi:hypothetical protein